MSALRPQNSSLKIQYNMPSETGVWTPEEAETGHVFDYRLAQWLAKLLPKNEYIIDMGCGTASYLRYFHDLGFPKLIGVEGTAVKGSEYGNVEIQDLTQEFDLIGVRGNVLCLEVAEHIPEEHMHMFLKNITRHTEYMSYLVMSWAIPGQDGLGHVNCRHNIDIIGIMKYKYGMDLDIEASLEGRAMVSDVAHWFRNTLMVFRIYGE